MMIKRREEWRKGETRRGGDYLTLEMDDND